MGESPHDPWDKCKLLNLKAFKSAWETYVDTSFACGLFEGPSGNDLLERLRSERNDNFNAAMAECLACWLFVGKFKMPIMPRPKGSNNHELEFLAKSPNEDLFIEVKAPFRPRSNQSWSGDDSDKIISCLNAAQKQFQKNTHNILVINPSLRIPLFAHRETLIHALYGETRIVMNFDPMKGQAISPATSEFFPDGSFLKVWPEKGTRFTRIGAVICVEEFYNERFNVVDHKIFILHNPHAKFSCEHIDFGDAPQLRRFGNYMKWSDGYAI